MDMNLLREIILASGIGFILYSLYRGVKSNQPNLWASYCVSIGIGATFLGIAVGLLGYDPDSAQTSAKALIGGMRIAFWSSAAGIICSLWLRWGIIDKSEKDPSPKTVSDLHGEISSLRADLKDFLERSVDNNMEALKTVVENVNNQMQEQLGDNFKKFNDGLGKALQWQEKYEGGLTKLLKALENTNKASEQANARTNALTEQTEKFGKHIELLNTTITNLEERQKTLDKTTEELSDKAQSRMKELADQTETFVDVVKKIEAFSDQQKASLKQNEEIQTNLNANLANFKTLAEEVSETVKNSNEEMKGLDLSGQTDQFKDISKTLENLYKDHGKWLEESKKAQEALNSRLETFKEIDTQAKEAFPAITDTLEKLVESSGTFQEQITANIAKTEKSNTTAFKEINDDLRKVVGQFRNLVGQISKASENTQITLQEEVLKVQEELNKSLTTLGDTLLTLSEKFAEDYEPLTESLKTVVQMAKKLQDQAEDTGPDQPDAE